MPFWLSLFIYYLFILSLFLHFFLKDTWVIGMLSAIRIIFSMCAFHYFYYLFFIIHVTWKKIMTDSFLLLGCKVDLSIPPWSVLWSGNQIISCNYLFLWLLDLLLLASFTDMLFSPEQPWGCSLVVLMDDDTLKEANTEVLIWIWIRIHTSQGPFLAIFAMELAECNANKTCTLKRVICTVCFCTGLINAFTAMLAVPWLGKRPKCQIWNH